MDRAIVPNPTTEHCLVVLAAVVNRRGETSERFVDAEYFDLWRIAMRERHGLQISDWQTLLWLPLSEYRRHARLFARQGPVRDVTRLELSHFDPRDRRTHHTTRYVARELVPEAAVRLEAHLWHPRSMDGQIIPTEGKVVGAQALPDGLHAA